MFAKAIVEVPIECYEPPQHLAAGRPDAGVTPAGLVSRRLFTIRAADSNGERSSASILVKRMYEKRGYATTSLNKYDGSSRITLIASEGENTLGTITIGFDTPTGLLVDDLFCDEVSKLRGAGREVCEFTKLAMDNVVRSKRVLASLFHVAYLIAHRINGIHDLMIEVNPRHVLYYEKMLGFEVMGAEKLNTRVNAPAVLLCLQLSHAKDQIAKFGGKPEFSASERSLYPYFFSAAEESGIIGRLQTP